MDGRPELTVLVDHDNGVVDCKGQQSDETGAVYSAYIEFTPDGQRLQLYFDAAAQQLRFVLSR